MSNSTNNHGIVWLASYPKSGNTWFRLFLSNLLNKSDDEIDLNEIWFDIASDRRLFDLQVGIESTDLSRLEMELLRPKAYERLAKNAVDPPVYFKIHDAYTYLPGGEPLVSQQTKAAVYLVRNPFDVAVSYSHHKGLSIDQTIDLMNDPNYVLDDARDGISRQLPQKTLGWSGHVESWLDQKDVPVHLIRYEDLHRDPVGTFTKATGFLGIECTGSDVQKSINKCDFDRLQAQERENGFRERPSAATSFFRSGKVGEWQKCLTETQISKIKNSHEKVLKRLGYLSHEGDLIRQNEDEIKSQKTG